MRLSIFAVLSIVPSVAGCTVEPGGGGGGTTADFCTSDCTRRVATGCTPAGYQASCVQTCNGRYTSYPGCAAQLQAVDACLQSSATYVCESGTVVSQPEAICADQGGACASCTGSDTACVF